MDGIEENELNEISDNVYELLRKKKLEEKDRQTNYLSDSQEKLKKNISKHIRNTMIQTLEIIEDEIGFLWEGSSKESDNIFDIYQKIRKRILDYGNNEIRAAEEEVKQYTVSWNRYSYNLKVKPKRTDNEK